MDLDLGEQEQRAVGTALGGMVGVLLRLASLIVWSVLIAYRHLQSRDLPGESAAAFTWSVSSTIGEKAYKAWTTVYAYSKIHLPHNGVSTALTASDVNHKVTIERSPGRLASLLQAGDKQLVNGLFGLQGDVLVEGEFVTRLLVSRG